jgi:hypothetical protein
MAAYPNTQTMRRHVPAVNFIYLIAIVIRHFKFLCATSAHLRQHTVMHRNSDSSREISTTYLMPVVSLLPEVKLSVAPDTQRWKFIIFDDEALRFPAIQSEMTIMREASTAIWWFRCSRHVLPTSLPKIHFDDFDTRLYRIEIRCLIAPPHFDEMTTARATRRLRGIK